MLKVGRDRRCACHLHSYETFLTCNLNSYFLETNCCIYGTLKFQIENSLIIPEKMCEQLVNNRAVILINLLIKTEAYLLLQFH